MHKRAEKGLVREDFVHALKEMDTYLDIGVDDLMEVATRAGAHARLRIREGLRVAQLMSREVVTVHPETSLAEAAHRMVSRRISGLAVVDDGQRLVGIITEADFLRALGVPSHHPAHHLWQTLEAMFSHAAVQADPDGRVADLMSRDVVTVRPDQTLHDVLETMKHHRIKRVVVVDDGRVVGMITRSDLVKVFFDRFLGIGPEPG